MFLVHPGQNKKSQTYNPFWTPCARRNKHKTNAVLHQTCILTPLFHTQKYQENEKIVWPEKRHIKLKFKLRGLGPKLYKF